MMNCLGLPAGVRLAIRGRYCMLWFIVVRLCRLFCKLYGWYGVARRQLGLIHPYLEFPKRVFPRTSLLDLRLSVSRIQSALVQNLG